MAQDNRLRYKPNPQDSLRTLQELQRRGAQVDLPQEDIGWETSGSLGEIGPAIPSGINVPARPRAAGGSPTLLPGQQYGLGEMAPDVTSPFSTKTNVGIPRPKLYSGGDPNEGAILALLGGLGKPKTPQAGIVPKPPEMFRQHTYNADVPGAPNLNAGAVQGEGLPPGPSFYMERTPGGQGMGGEEWARANQGPSAQVKALSSLYRPTEELYRQAANPTQTVSRDVTTRGFGQPWETNTEQFQLASSAPGAAQSATQQLQERLQPEEFQRLLGQKQQETIAGAQTSLDPTVQASAEAEARRATYPAQAQAEGLKNQALLGFLGRQATAEGSVAGRQATRDAAALGALERAMTAITSREDLTPEDQAELLRLRESIELVKRGVFFLSDLGFDEQQLDELADLEDSYGLDEGF